MHFLLTYQYTDDYLAKRGQYRNDHLRHAWAAQQRGQLILGGAAGDPPDSAVILFDVQDTAVMDQFVQADPYYRNGLVRSYNIQPWTTVVGDLATSPIHPTAA